MATPGTVNHRVILTPLEETTPLLEIAHTSPSSKKGRCFSLSFSAVIVTTVVIVWNSRSGIQPAEQSLWSLPESPLYRLPMNESCQEKYLDHSSRNLCQSIHNLCLDTFHCPRRAMPQFNPDATLPGFISLYGNGTLDFVPSRHPKICQGEVFKARVKRDMEKQKHPIPGEIISCGEEGRTYALGSEGCVVDGNHGVTACKLLGMPVKVIQFNCSFFSLVDKVKSYIDSCRTRLLSATICQME